MRSNFLLLFIILFTVCGFAKEKKYPVTDIPDQLLKNADAVIREYSVDKQIERGNYVVTKEKFVVTILNKDAENLGYFYEFHDVTNTISDYKLNAYNKYGDQIYKSKSKDFKDVKAFSGFSLFDDNRVIYNQWYSENYPYTVEIEFSNTDKQTLFLGNWYPVPDYQVAVQMASYTVSTPEQFPIRNKTKNFDADVSVTKEDGKIKYSWILLNYQAQKYEQFGPYFSDIFPNVKLAPNEFYYDGSKGYMSTWEGFSSWDYALIKNRDELPEETVALLKELVSEASSELEKVQILYNYLQENTRYVSVQLGIGGFQPFDASTVDRNKYGDCKALSNYMKAMLKAVGIDSKYGSIYAGSRVIDADFPSQQFNHIILCVPKVADTVWLECTSQRIPFGVLAKNSYNKHVLIAKEKGGKLVKTPTIPDSVNYISTINEVKLNADGNITYQLSDKHHGLHFYDYFFLQFESVEDQKKSLYKTFSAAGHKINNYKIVKADDCLHPTMCVELDGAISRFAKTAGDRLIFNSNLFGTYSNIPYKYKNRKQPILISSHFNRIDSVIIAIPNEYSVEYVPDALAVEKDYGSYTVNYSIENNQIICIKEFMLFKGTYPPEEYEAFRAFYKEYKQANSENLVLIKN